VSIFLARVIRSGYRRLVWLLSCAVVLVVKMKSRSSSHSLKRVGRMKARSATNSERLFCRGVPVRSSLNLAGILTSCWYRLVLGFFR
jgi:hypothetical protein